MSSKSAVKTKTPQDIACCPTWRSRMETVLGTHRLYRSSILGPASPCSGSELEKYEGAFA